MKKTLRVKFALLCALLALPMLFSSGCASRIVHVYSKTEVSKQTLIKELKRTKLIFIGELHNKRSHHAIQLGVIEALYDSGVPVAIGLEMIKAEDQASLDKWVAGALSEESMVEVYYKSWKIPWDTYRDIFIFAKEARIPIIGLNVPDELVKRIFKNGSGSLTAEESKRIESVECDVDPVYERFIRDAMKEHKVDASMYKSFCEAQMLWDKSMSARVLEYMEDSPERTLVVLAGSGHAWKRAMPKRVGSRTDVPFLVILPDVPDKSDEADVSVEDADYLWTRP